MPVGWRTWAHSFAQKQKSEGMETRSGVELWEDPVASMPVGVHDFPDGQRALYGLQAVAGPAVGEFSSVIFGTLADDAILRSGGTDLAVQFITYRILVATLGVDPNVHGWANVGVSLYTPLNPPEPDPVANNTVNRFAFLRPRLPSPSAGVGRAIGIAGTAATQQSVVPLSPHFYAETSIGVPWPPSTTSLAQYGWNNPWPKTGRIDFNPPLIIPATQFIALTTSSIESPGIPVNLQLQASFFYREVSV